MTRRLQKLHIGIAGACARGGSFRQALQTRADVACVQAVCDAEVDGLEAARAHLGAAEAYPDYGDMLARADLDAVLVATPMHLHAEQSIAALDRGLHVLCEVTAAVSVDECRRLVAAAAASRGCYMMAENCNYTVPSLVVAALVEQGFFGTPYFGEGEYLHELKALNERTRWRRRWQTGIDGITYGTHALGPLLSWMPGQRVVEVCCAGSGHHYRDPAGQPYHQDTHLLLGRLSSGGLVKLRVDMISDRPHVTTTFQLQGTDGCYESARAPGERDRVWLRSRSPDAGTWLDLADLTAEFLPERWRGTVDPAAGGHGGSDMRVVQVFLDGICRGICRQGPPPPGVHQAMDMTLPGLVSQASMAQAGAWLPVPDSRDWVAVPAGGSSR